MTHVIHVVIDSDLPPSDVVGAVRYAIESAKEESADASWTNGYQDDLQRIGLLGVH